MAFRRILVIRETDCIQNNAPEVKKNADEINCLRKVEEQSRVPKDKNNPKVEQKNYGDQEGTHKYLTELTNNKGTTFSFKKLTKTRTMLVDHKTINKK